MSKHKQSPVAAAVAAAIPPAVTTTAELVALSGLVTVDTLIAEAGAAEGTMYAKAREAAKLAASELSTAIPIVANRVKAVVDAHAVAFALVGHNVKAIFSDALWILAAPTSKVEVPIIGAPKTQAQQAVVPASDALTMSKNTLRDVAKQVREANGAGRASGGGRPSQTVIPAPTATVGAPAPGAVVNTWFDEFKAKLSHPGDLAKIVAILEAEGYTVTRKGAKLMPSTASAPHADLASQLATMKGAMAPAPAN